MRYKNKVVFMSLGGIALAAGIDAGEVDAAPVEVEFRGQIESLNPRFGESVAPGNAAVGDEAIIRVVYEVDPDSLLVLDGGGRQTATDAVDAVELSVNGETYTFDIDGPLAASNFILHRDNTVNTNGNTDNVVVSWGSFDRTTFLSESVDIEFDYPVDTFGVGADVDVPVTEFLAGSANFTIIGENGEQTRLFVNLDEILNVGPIGVPTPAAIGGLVLLGPIMLLRRRREK